MARAQVFRDARRRVWIDVYGDMLICADDTVLGDC